MLLGYPKVVLEAFGAGGVPARLESAVRDLIQSGTRVYICLLYTSFADAVINDKETPVTGEDGLYPVLMAAAATKSLHLSLIHIWQGFVPTRSECTAAFFARKSGGSGVVP